MIAWRSLEAKSLCVTLNPPQDLLSASFHLFSLALERELHAWRFKINLHV